MTVDVQSFKEMSGPDLMKFDAPVETAESVGKSMMGEMFDMPRDELLIM